MPFVKRRYVVNQQTSGLPNESPRRTSTPRESNFGTPESLVEIALRRRSFNQRLAPLGRSPYQTPNRAAEVGVLESPIDISPIPYSSVFPLGASGISGVLQDPVKSSEPVFFAGGWSSSLVQTKRQWLNTPLSRIQRDSTRGSSTTADSVLGEKPADGPKKETRGRKKRARDMPKRPLSAYNLFFKQERQRIIKSQPVDRKESPVAGIGAKADDVAAPSVPTAVNEDQSGSAYSIDNSALDSGPKRKDRAIPHRRIGFESLAKVIGKRWKSLSEDENALYQAEAAVELQTYRTQIEIYKEKCKRNGVYVV
jgi:hypothetical protein